MPIDPNLPTTNVNNLEQEKFQWDATRGVIVKTSAEGEMSVSGLKVGGRITSVTLIDGTWIKAPTTALISRNTMSIQNDTGYFYYINYDLDGDPNTLGLTTGKKVYPASTVFYDIKDTVDIWVLPQSGQSFNLIVEEIS